MRKCFKNTNFERENTTTTTQTHRKRRRERGKEGTWGLLVGESRVFVIICETLFGIIREGYVGKGSKS
jgi:hypothetical protein